MEAICFYDLFAGLVLSTAVVLAIGKLLDRYAERK